MQKIKKLYCDSLSELKVTRNMVLCGLMAALAIVLSYTTSIFITPYIRIGFSGLPNRVVDYMFGPAIGGIFGGILDIIKFVLKPQGTFFPGYTITAVLGGIVYGTILYNKPLKLWRVLIAEAIVKVFLNCGLNTLWTSMLYGKAFFVILPGRALKNLIMLPIDTIILFFTLTLVSRICDMPEFRHFGARRDEK